MAWFASGTGSAFAVRHRPEKGRRESMRVGGVGAGGGAATPTLAGEIPGGASGPTVVRAAPGDADGRFALFDEIFSSGGDGADVHLHPDSDDAGTEASLERYSMARRRDRATEAGGSRSGRDGPPSTATSHAVSGLRGGTPCSFELYARGTTVKGAGSFATAIPLPRSCESPARSPEPPAGPPDDGNLENAFPAGEPTPYRPEPSPPVNY